MTAHHMRDIPPDYDLIVQKTQNDGMSTQIKLCVDWLNSILKEKNVVVSDLGSFFDGGVNLIYLVEILSGERIGKYFEEPKFPFHKLDNVSRVCSFMKEKLGVDMIGFERDLLDGNEKVAVQFVFSLMRKFQVSWDSIESYENRDNLHVITNNLDEYPQVSDQSQMSSDKEVGNTEILDENSLVVDLENCDILGDLEENLEKDDGDLEVSGEDHTEAPTNRIQLLESYDSSDEEFIVPSISIEQISSESESEKSRITTELPKEISDLITPVQHFTASYFQSFLDTEESFDDDTELNSDLDLDQLKVIDEYMEQSFSVPDINQSSEIIENEEHGKYDANIEDLLLHSFINEVSEEFYSQSRFRSGSLFPDTSRRKKIDYKKSRSSVELKTINKSITEPSQVSKRQYRREQRPASCGYHSGQVKASYIKFSNSNQKSNINLSSGSRAKRKKRKELGDVHYIYIQTIQSYIRRMLAMNNLQKKREMKRRLTKVKKYHTKEIILIQSIARTKIFTPNNTLKTWLSRYHLIKELVDSEERYLEGLNYLRYVYLKEIHESKSYLPRSLYRSLCRNLDVIINFNSLFCLELKERLSTLFLSDSEIGDLMIKYSTFFKVYSPYINHYENVADLVSSAAEKYSELSEILHNCRSNPDSNYHTLFSLLITPIQRVARYEVFLKDMLEISNPDPREKDQLEYSLSLFQRVNHYMNVKKEEFENSEKALEIICDMVDFPIHTFRYGSFVHSSNLLRSKIKQSGKGDLEWNPVTLFFLADSMICAKYKTSKKGKVYRYLEFHNYFHIELVDIDSNWSSHAFIFGVESRSSAELTLYCTEFLREKTDIMLLIDSCISKELEGICCHFTNEERMCIPKIKYIKHGSVEFLEKSRWRLKYMFLHKHRFLLYDSSEDFDAKREPLISEHILDIKINLHFYKNNPEIQITTKESETFFISSKDLKGVVKLLNNIRNYQRNIINHFIAERLSKIPLKPLLSLLPVTGLLEIMEGNCFRKSNKGVSYELIRMHGDSKTLKFFDLQGKEKKVVNLSFAVPISREDLKVCTVMNRKVFFGEVRSTKDTIMVTFGFWGEMAGWIDVLNGIIKSKA
eukprot:TRINITY_DN8005_c0_g1_i1.p1 TRINITY_DN8005_c0_g1~~TRINITY_DN8005_c0_g1_i1.p1  ORF type:complete len:1092 (-),score=221.70 TRINITY_DN8005_c0_g1_i1:23-3298(-)